MAERVRVSSGSPFESQVGYCRAVAVDDRIFVSGTVAMWPDGTSKRPANTRAWPEGRIYGYDRIYDSRDMGYRGPTYAMSSIPDRTHFQVASIENFLFVHSSRPEVVKRLETRLADAARGA